MARIGRRTPRPPPLRHLVLAFAILLSSLLLFFAGFRFLEDEGATPRAMALDVAGLALMLVAGILVWRMRR